MTGPGVVVRPATDADLPALAALEAASFTAPGSPAWSSALLAAELGQPTAMVLVAVIARGDGNDEDDGDCAPVGYAAFRHVGPEAELLRVAVAPKERSRGIARALVEDGIGRLRQRGVATCFLEVRPANAPALALYERLGFRTVDRRRRYFPDGADALVLRLDVRRRD